MLPVPDSQLDALREKASFKVEVVPTDLWFGMLNDQDRKLVWHETVLKPLLVAATGAWAYAIDPASAVYQSGSRLLKKHAGKYAIDTRGDPVSGAELFWNASGGKRGSIALVIPEERFPGEAIFPHCNRAYVTANPKKGHTPSAVRYAKAQVAGGGVVVCLFPETNGFAWFDVFAEPALLDGLFHKARAVLPGFAR